MTSFLLRPPFIAALALAGAAHAAPLTPNAGAIAASGTLDNGAGRFSVQATLRDGNFTGTATVQIGASAIAGPLIAKRSYVENGRCYFYLENGKARAAISGKCDDAGLDGRFETFVPGGDMKSGNAKGTFTLAAAPAAAPAGRLPSGKLTCAFNEPKIGIRMGELTQYSLRFSNMTTLTLQPGGSYVAGTGGSGRYELAAGGKIRLTSGHWAGAVGTLENDRSGAPAVVFHIEENRRPDGVHIVDPYSTHCTAAR